MANSRFKMSQSLEERNVHTMVSSVNIDHIAPQQANAKLGFEKSTEAWYLGNTKSNI